MDNLPLDILLSVLSHLPLQAILVLRRTSKNLYAVTHLRALWAILFRTHILDQHIPYPDIGPLDDLSAQDLEALTRRALALRHTWSSPQPVPRRNITFGPPSDPVARVIFLQFLPGRSNRYLISVRMTSRPRAYLLQCWDVAPDHPKCVAELVHADGPYGGVVLNSDPSSSAVLAMQSAMTETFSIRFDAQDPECGFVTESTIDGLRELHLLCGSTLVTRHPDDDGALSLWDLSDLRHEKLHMLNPSLVQPDDRIQAIHLAHDYALLVRIQSIEIYSTVPRPSLLSPRGTPIAYPLAQFKFQWRTDSVVLAAQHASTPTSPSFPPPIHLLVRFGSIYPWPVNVLHHYRLLPNPTYHLGGRKSGRTSTPTSSAGPTAPSSPHSPFGPSHPYPRPPSHPVTTEYNLPYDPHPHPTTHIIGSPVRLFGQSAMALGRYGTALWLDNHTEVWSGPSERGQRLAGRLVRVGDDNDEDGGDEGMNERRKSSGEVRESSRGRDHDSDPGGNGTKTVPSTSTSVTTGLATDAELTPAVTSVSSSSGASMLFGVHGDDAWTRVAMEEEAGRIALGHVDGAITLLEY